MGSRSARGSPTATGPAPENDEEVPSVPHRRESLPARRSSFSIQHSTQRNAGGTQGLRDEGTGGQGRYRSNPVAPGSLDPALLHEERNNVSERISNKIDNNEELDAGIPPLIRNKLPETDEATRPGMCGVLTTAGTSILSVGTAAQIRAQRQRFLDSLDKLIEEDTAAWIENRRIVREMLAEEISKAEAARVQ